LADISIVRNVGFAPLKVTLPVTVAAFASSTATAGAAAGAASSFLASSLLPPQLTRSRAAAAPHAIQSFVIVE
jgi:hypothetical protein